MRLTPLPAFDDNYIWTLADAAGHALVVDPGDAAPLLAAAEQGLRPVAVLITHHHADHIGGVRDLLTRWPDLTVFAPEDARISDASRRVSDGERIEIAALGMRFEIIAVPGHTRSHIAYLQCDTDAPLLFCGDTLFHLGCGRLFEGTPAQMLGSLERLSSLPDATRVCCTHEYTLSNARFALAVDPDNAALQAEVAAARAQREVGQPTLPTTIAAQRAANPFLRSAMPELRASVERHAGRSLDAQVEVFAELRRWKDGFR